jgi:hypothetical protein
VDYGQEDLQATYPYATTAFGTLFLGGEVERCLGFWASGPLGGGVSSRTPVVQNCVHFSASQSVSAVQLLSAEPSPPAFASISRRSAMQYFGSRNRNRNRNRNRTQG